MRNFIKDFKDFATQGSLMDVAVGMIIGAAFTAIITSLVDDIISPLIGLFVKSDFNDLTATVMGVDIQYGKFIMALLNFIIIAFVLFLMIRGMARLRNAVKKDDEKVVPSTKVCPYCKTEINIEATRCPSCTSKLEEEQEKA